MDLVTKPDGEEHRFSKYVDSPEEGCVYVLEADVLVQYARLADGTLETGGAEVDFSCAVLEHEVPRFRRMERLLREDAPPLGLASRFVVFVSRGPRIETAEIQPASGIVGVTEPGDTWVRLCHQGDKDGERSLPRFVERVLIAHGHLNAQARTTREVDEVPADCLIDVGTFDPTSCEITLTDQESEQALAAWLGVEAVDPAELRLG